MEQFHKVATTLQSIGQQVSLLQSQLLSLRGYVRILEQTEADREPSTILSYEDALQKIVSTAEHSWELYCHDCQVN